MKFDDFIVLKSEIHCFIRKTILLERRNILGEVIHYDMGKTLTKKEKTEIKNEYEHSPFVEEVHFTGTTISVIFSTNIGYKEVADYLKNMPEFSERLLPSSYVFDENESVKWNREKVAEENEEIKERKMLDIEARKLLKEAQKKAIFYEMQSFFDIKEVNYESFEILYDYLKGIYNNDEEVCKQMFPLVDTVLKFAESEKLMKRNTKPLN